MMSEGPGFSPRNTPPGGEYTSFDTVPKVMAQRMDYVDEEGAPPLQQVPLGTGPTPASQLAQAPGSPGMRPGSPTVPHPLGLAPPMPPFPQQPSIPLSRPSVPWLPANQ